MARPKKEAPKAEIVKKAAAPKVAKVFVSTPEIVVKYKQNIDQYLKSKGITSYHEGHKIGLTIEQIKDLILNY